MNIDISDILGILAFIGITAPNFIKWINKPNLEVTGVKIITGGIAQTRPGLPKEMTTISWNIKNKRRLMFLGRTVKNVSTTFLIDKEVGEGSVWNYSGIKGPIKIIPLETKTNQIISFDRIFPEGVYTLYLNIDSDGKPITIHREKIKVNLR